MKASNVRYVYFVHPVQVRNRNTVKPVHVVSNDRFKLEMKSNFLEIEIDGFITLVPLHNIASIQIEGVLDKPA